MDSEVLIVPSGIETDGENILQGLVRVLIVPSGIETILNILLTLLQECVLIVPSGIETWSNKAKPEGTHWSINCT